MSHCQCVGIEKCFNSQRVSRELARYRRSGPLKNTRLLVEALQLQGAGVAGLTLLDIGGGVGAIVHGLLHAGVRQAADVDASAAYLAAAREEAERRRLADRVTFQHGDFVALASAISPADIVTLDRVICCYEDMPALVRLSAARAERLYGVVYPRDPWWVRILNRPYALILRLLRTPLRFYIHSSTAVDAIIRGQGLERRFYRKAGLWQIVVYARPRSQESDAPPLAHATEREQP
jgi:SAM-dependent methyltransferase